MLGSEKENWGIWLDVILIFALIGALVLSFVPGASHDLQESFLIVLSVLGVFPVLTSAVKALIKRRLTIDLLASIALTFSFLSGEWFSAAFINLMLAFARVFDNWTQARAKNIIERLLKYRPSKVKIKNQDKILEIPVEKIKIGDLVAVEAGDRIAIDGVVISGQASINQATLTGESEPVLKKAGDNVFSSTLNETGSLLVKAEKIGEDTTLAKIVNLISEASRQKPRDEKVADKFTTWYILATLLGSLVIYIFLGDLNLILAVLLVTCADDIAVAIPLSFTVAIARAAKRGIIIKGANVVEDLSNLDVFITDKTGTLTFGRPKVKQIVTFDNFSEEQFLGLVGMGEINSHHPVGRAIVRFVEKKKVNISAPDEFNELPGEGIEVVKNGKKYTMGKMAFLEKRGFKAIDPERQLMDKFKREGKSLAILGFDNRIAGFIVLEDEIRPFAKQIISKTKKLGIKSWIMLTGDNEKVALKVAKWLGIKKFKANMTPDQKVDFIKEFRKANSGKVAMVGDGVNDAAALALADVSFAMGAIGSDVAIEAADIALMQDKLERIPESLVLSHKTLKTVRQNFLIWGLTNVVGLVLVFFNILGPRGASAYNFLTDFLPIFNALKLFEINLESDHGQ